MIRHQKPVVVRPRAFYVRLITAVIPVLGLYFLMAYDLRKAIDFLRYFFGLSNTWTAVASIPLSVVVSVTVYALAKSLREWVWETVYIIVGTVRFSGREGSVVPAGGLILDSNNNEYIVTKNAVVGKQGFVEVELCIPWVQQDRRRNKKSSALDMASDEYGIKRI